MSDVSGLAEKAKSTLQTAGEDAESNTAVDDPENADETHDTKADSKPIISDDYDNISANYTFTYDQMTDSRKKVYRQLLNAIGNKKQEFTVTVESTEDIEPALQGVMMDHPEFFWLDGQAKIYGTPGGGLEKITLNFNIDASQIDDIEAQIESRVQEFLASLPEGASQYTKARAAYQYIIRNTDYGFSSRQNQNIQSVFLDHISVCAGYAKAYQYLLHRACVPCAYITGTITTSGAAHAWNLVTIDGINTLVDPTWGDPTYDESSEDSKKLDVIYDYLCVTSEEMERAHHEASGDYAIPDCTSTAYDFYRLLGDYLTSCDPAEIEHHLYSTVRNGESVTYLKFENDADYQTALTQIFQDGGLIEKPLQKKMKNEGTNSIQYFYSKSDEIRTIKIFW